MEAYTLIKTALRLEPPFFIKSVSLSGNGNFYVEIAYDEDAVDDSQVLGYEYIEWDNFIFFKHRSVVYGSLPILREGLMLMPWEHERSERTRAEEQFLGRIKERIKERLGDPDFGVGELERWVGMSHAQFYRRLERLLGYSANVLIRRMRIERALELMEREDLLISDVSYEAGFRDPAYFSKVFREELGLSPTAFRQEKNHVGKEKKLIYK
jgi:AraC-like DNA-binding protein